MQPRHPSLVHHHFPTPKYPVQGALLPFPTSISHGQARWRRGTAVRFSCARRFVRPASCLQPAARSAAVIFCSGSWLRCAEHSTPLREIDKCDWKRAGKNHDTHESYSCFLRVSCALEEYKLSQDCTNAPATSCHPRNQSQRPAKASTSLTTLKRNIPSGYEGNDTEGEPACSLYKEGKQDHDKNGSSEIIHSPQYDAQNSANALYQPQTPQPSSHSKPFRHQVRQVTTTRP